MSYNKFDFRESIYKNESWYQFLVRKLGEKGKFEMQRATIELSTYVDLNDDGTLNVLVYTGNEDEPSINHNVDFYNMLTNLLESHLIPADTPYLEEDEYGGLIDSLTAFQNNVIETVASIVLDAQKYRKHITTNKDEDEVYPVREDIPAELWGKPINWRKYDASR